MPTSDDYVLRHLYTGALAGQAVKYDGSAAVGALQQVGSLSVPGGIVTPWVIYASPSTLTGTMNPTPNRLVLTLGMHGGSVTFTADLPVTGGIWATPPAESLTIGAVANTTFAAPPGGSVAAQRVSFGPAHHGAPPTVRPMVYTEPMKTAVAISGIVSFTRPALAMAYRFISTSDLASYSLFAAQITGPSTVINVDASSATQVIGAPLTRDGWVPLHPACQSLSITNASAAVRDFAVQWLLAT